MASPGRLCVGGVVVVVCILLSSLLTDIIPAPHLIHLTYNNYSNMDSLHSNGSSHPTPPPPQHVSILLLAYYRSGSSFTAELLTHPRNSLYLFEPDKYKQFRLLPDFQGGGEREVSFYRRLFLCRYQGLEGFFFNPKVYPFLARDRNMAILLKHNTTHHNVTAVEDLCRRQRVRLVKTIHFHLEDSILGPLIKVAQEVNVKVVHLVRDPRGMYSSRLELYTAMPPAEKDATAARMISVESMCEEMRRDIALGRLLTKALPNQYKLLRYEDVARAPENVALTLYRDFLHIEPDVTKLKTFISRHIHPRPIRQPLQRRKAGFIKVGRYSTVREDPVKIAYRWKSRLSAEMVKKIEFSCSDVISELHYNT